MKITVSELIVRFMERLGIDHIFGMPGAHILPVYDSLYHSSIKSVLAKHEQGASFMASGYVRACGKISACITTAGPGATNLITGIANAYVDKQPVLIISGETSTHIFGKGGLQESSGEGGSICQDTLFKSITLYAKLIERTDYMANVLNRAAKILLADSSGPVLLSIPFNIQKELVDEEILDQIKTSKNHQIHYDDITAVKDFVHLIQASGHPVIVAGYGCIASGAQAQVAQLSESLNIPVSTSLKGKGVIDEHSELSLGSLGVTSYGEAYDYIMEQSDLIIFLGAGFNERTSYVWNKDLLKGKKIVQIDNNIEQLEKVFKADVAILGDLRLLLSAALKQLEELAIEKKQLTHILEAYRSEGDKNIRQSLSQFKARFPLVDAFFTELQKQHPEGIMVYDDNIIFAQNFFQVSLQNCYFPNSGVSSLGHAIPAAIGGRFARQDRSPFAILGDGGFQMCCMEIMTAVNYQLPLNIIMFNNSTMGLIRKNQFQQYDKRYIDCDFINPDYALLSQSFGMNHYKITKESELQGLFDKVDINNAINLIEIFIDKDTFPGYSSRR